MTSHTRVSVQPRFRPVRRFGSFTEDLEAMASWLASCGVDAVAMEVSATFAAQRWERESEELASLIRSLRRFQERSDKPFVTALHPSYVEAAALKARDALQEAGLAVFPSFERAANALAKSVSLKPSLRPGGAG